MSKAANWTEAEPESDVDYLRSIGGEALGARLRRLSNRIDADVAQVYKEVGQPFEQRWYSILDQLILHKTCTVSQLAATLGVTHASVSQARKSLEKAGLIESRVEKTDTRRQLISLSTKGQQFVVELTPIWEALKCAAVELSKEADGLMLSLDKLDDALKRRTVLERTMAALAEGAVDGEAAHSFPPPKIQR